MAKHLDRFEKHLQELEPSGALSLYGMREGKLADFIRKYNAYIMLALPCLITESIGLVISLASEFLIIDYLLQKPSLQKLPLLYLGLSEIAYWAVNLLFLWPVFKASNLINKKEEISPLLWQKAKNRVYNFPVFIIISTYTVWVAGAGYYYFMRSHVIPFGPFITAGLLSTVLNAIMAYYIAEVMNRFFFIPHWFRDGKIDVSFKLLRRPTLFLRFFDQYLVVGVFPIISVVGLIYLTSLNGGHDPEESTRLVFATGTIGIIFWIYGFVMTWLNANTFISPLNAMARATEQLSNEDYTTRIMVQSDDQLGRLQLALNEMAHQLEEKMTIKTLFGHYVSPVVRDLILEQKINTNGDSIEAVILFSDIRSFTSLTEKHEPDEIVKALNIHFSRIVELVSDNQGFVDKFIGDAVMAVFDAELCEKRHRELALNAAMAILDGMSETNRQLKEIGLGPIKIGIGLACGKVIRGNVGSKDRRELTVVGDIVNIASRLESVTKTVGYPIVLTKESLNKDVVSLPGYDIVQLNPMQLKGKDKPVDILALNKN